MREVTYAGAYLVVNQVRARMRARNAQARLPVLGICCEGYLAYLHRGGVDTMTDTIVNPLQTAKPPSH